MLPQQQNRFNFQTQMETLWNLYQERLTELNAQFIELLSQFQSNQLLTTPELAKYRIEYVGSIVEKTLKTNQQRLILKLYEEINQLKQVNHKLMGQIDELRKQRFEELKKQAESGTNDEFELRDKSLGSTKVSTIGYRRDNSEADSFLESCSSKFGKTTKSKVTSLGINRKQKQLVRGNNVKSSKRQQKLAGQQHEDTQMELMKMSFKYMKL